MIIVISHMMGIQAYKNKYNTIKLPVVGIVIRSVIRFKSIYIYFQLNRCTSTESIQIIFIESIPTNKLSAFSYR